VIVFSIVLAAALILAQGFAVWGFLRFVKSFGAYTTSQGHLTAALLSMQESNLLLHREQMRVLEELRAMQHPSITKEVA
jgi:hypothetical protein